MAFSTDKTRQGAAGVSTGYDIDQSLRFNDDDSAYLSWTAGTATDRKKFTFSCWAKLTEITGGNQPFISAGDTNDFVSIQIDNAGRLKVAELVSGAWSWNLTSTMKLRDFSSWYHILMVVDTDLAETNRVRVYVNGSEITVWDTETYPSSGYSSLPINGSVLHKICYDPWEYGSHYLAEVNFVDGQALTPADFGETGTYGEWKPIEYSGTYGNNGFYLPFNQDYSVEGFSAVTYSGEGGSRYVGGTGFQPDLTWIKERSNTSKRNIFFI